jgi:hypothetical protein
MTHRSKRRRGLPLLATSLVLAIALTGCGARSFNPIAPADDSATDVKGGIQGTRALNQAIDAQEQVSSMLLSLRGVVGTSAGLDAAGRGTVRVMVERADVTGVPANVNGLKVEKVVTGRFRAWALAGRFRPIRVGVSVGNENECLPGTIGCIVEKHGHRYVLSANHVLARQNQAHLGEVIVQPSLPDLDPDGCRSVPAWAAIARLADFQRVYYDGTTPNFMDAAIAEVTLPPGQVRGTTPREYYGAPGTTPIGARLGMKVQKLGRTTALTHGVITGVNAKVEVDFPSGTALLVGQLETSGRFGDFGDSGSLVITDDDRQRPVGMVIGGDDTGAAIATPIGRVLSRFGVRISGDD